MSKLPGMRYSGGITRVTQVIFGGLRHTVNCGDGELFDMQDMSCADYPVLSTRKWRREGWQIDGAKKIYADHGILLYVKQDGTIWYVRKNAQGALQLGYTEDVDRVTFVRFGDRVIIMPDKKLLNVKYEILETVLNASQLPTNASYGEAYAVITGQSQETQEVHYDVFVSDGTAWINNGPLVKPMDAAVTAESTEENITVTVLDGTIYGEPAKGNTLSFSGLGIDLRDYFSVGDGIKISGMTVMPENNKIPIIREMNDHILRFSENVFKMPKTEEGERRTEYDEIGEIKLERTVPEMDFWFEHDNRLWGARGKEIFASKLGDPTNFNVFDGLSTDSWYIETQKQGKITGGCSYGNYPIFFRPDSICTVYGTVPQGYQLYDRAAAGMAEGENKSAAMAGGVLFYLSDHGIMAYSGDYPQNMQQVFGDGAFRNAMSASDGTRLYLQMQRGSEPAALYCYDSLRGLWMKESGRFVSLTQADGSVLALDKNGRVFELFGNEWGFQEEQDELNTFAEFGDFTDAPDRKGLSKLLMRLELEQGTSLTVKVKYQGESDWETVREVVGDGKKDSHYIAIIPHRTDSYRVRIESVGGWRLFSMTRERYIGSPIR